MNNGIVLHKLKMVYWYIPKVACTTLKIHFADLCGLPYDKSDPISVHDYCWNQWEKVSEPIPGYGNFALIRNPFYKIESLYIDKIFYNYSELVFGRFGGFYPKMPFKNFLFKIMSIENPDIHFERQSNLIPKTNDLNLQCFEDNTMLKTLPIINKNPKPKRNFLESEVNYYIREIFQVHYHADYVLYGTRYFSL
jgi:hypothetical protein